MGFLFGKKKNIEEHFINYSGHTLLFSYLEYILGKKYLSHPPANTTGFVVTTESCLLCIPVSMFILAMLAPQKCTLGLQIAPKCSALTVNWQDHA